MARSRNPLFKDMSGALNKQMVVKQYDYGTVVSVMPDMSKVKPSQLQKYKRSVFAEGVAYAQSILRDPKKKAAYQKKLKKGESVYHKALQEYLKKAKKKWY